MGGEAYGLLTRAFQASPPEFTDGPGIINLGTDPSRDPAGRGDIFNADLRQLAGDLVEAAANEVALPVSPESQVALENYVVAAPDVEEGTSSLFAGPGSALPAPALGGPPENVAGGPPLPWEGSFPGGCSNSASAVVNSNTGNHFYSLPILGFQVRGGMSLNLVLYHNSNTYYTGSFGSKWSCNFDARYQTNFADGELNNSCVIMMRFGNGRYVPYTFNFLTQRFESPTGFYDYIVATGTTLHFPSYTLVTKEGTKYGFGQIEAGAAGERRGILKWIEDRNGNRITINREANTGRMLSVTDPTGRSDRRISFAYNGVGGVTKIRDNHPTLNREWTFTYDSGGITKITYPPTTFGGVSPERNFQYDANSNITKETDLRGKEWRVYYDEYDRVTCFNEPGVYYSLPGFPQGYHFSYSYNTAVMSDPFNRNETHFYSRGFLQTIQDTAGKTERFDWAPARRLGAYWDKNGQVWSGTEDDRGNQLSTVTPMGRQEHATYNLDNTVATRSGDLTPSTYEFSYDSYGRPTAVARQVPGDPLQVLTSGTYTTTGLLQTATTYPGAGNPSRPYTFAQDVYGYTRLVQANGFGASTSSTNCIGQVAWARNEIGQQTNYEYDNWDRVTRVTKPNGDSVVVNYDL